MNNKVSQALSDKELEMIEAFRDMLESRLKLAALDNKLSKSIPALEMPLDDLRQDS
jgi:hypothetical protein